MVKAGCGDKQKQDNRDDSEAMFVVHDGKIYLSTNKALLHDSILVISIVSSLDGTCLGRAMSPRILVVPASVYEPVLSRLRHSGQVAETQL